MRVWLDDVRPMPNGFDIHVTTAPQALELVQTGKVSYVSFDNDLGPDEAGQGYQVADLIERLAFQNKIPRIGWDVHSANPVRRQHIIIAMSAADRFWENWGIRSLEAFREEAASAEAELVEEPSKAG